MDDTDDRLDRTYRELEQHRYPAFRARIFSDPDIAGAYPDHAGREAFIRQAFDHLIDTEIDAIRARPGVFGDNLRAELYLRHAPDVAANDNRRERIPPSPPPPPRERER